MENNADYSQYEDKSPSDLLQQISLVADEQHRIEAELVKAEDRVKEINKRLMDVSQGQLPELMEEAGISKFTTKSGVTVEIKETIRASIPKRHNDEAIGWLEEHGFEKLVKRNFVIQFNREDQAWANKFEGDLKKRKKPLPCEQKKGVHAQTLSSWVREQLGDGKEIPEQLFGVYRERKSKISV